MSFHQLFAVSVLVAIAALPVTAQDQRGDQPTPVPPGAASAPNDAGEPELEEVVVQPPEEPEGSQQPADGPTVAPNSYQGPSDPFDLPNSYPNLEQLRFEGLQSALRSTRSIFDSPKATSIIDSIDLEERQPRNMIEAVEREVGVLVQRTGAGQASPFIRGLTGPQTLILVDGIRMNNSTFRFGPNQYFALVDPGMVEQIEIVRGPQSVLWGSDAIGGVINIVTRSANTRFANYVGGQFIERFGTADGGSYSRVNVEGSVNRWGAFAGASCTNVNILERGGDLGIQPFTNYNQYAGDVKVDYLIDPCQMLTVSLQHFQQMNVPRTDKWPGEARRFTPQMRDLGYVRWQGTAPDNPVIDRFMLTASFGRQEEGTFRRKPPASLTEDRSNFDVGTTGINLIFGTDLACVGSLTYGIDWYHDEVNATSERVDLTGVNPPTPRVPQFPNDSYYERFGAFLQWDVDLTERLAAVTGVRYSSIETGATVALFDPTDPLAPPVDTPILTNFQDWTASVGLSYKLTPRVRLVGSIAEGFRAPSLDDLTSVSDNVNEGIDIPNPALTPETSINYEVGLKFDLDRFRAQTFVFWTDLEDLLAREKVNEIPDPSGPPGATIDILQRQNVGSAQIQGYELAGEFLFTPTWSAYGNLTYIYGQNISDNEPLSRIPPTQGVIGLRWRDRQARRWFDAYGWLVATQDRLSDRDIRDSRIPDGGTPGYGTLNMRLGWCVGQHQRVTLGIENITDKAYRVHGSGVDGPGISGQFGYELFY